MRVVDIEVRLALPNELDAVLAVLDEAAAWLQSIGVQQWPEFFSRDAELVEQTRRFIDAGYFYVAAVG